MSDAYRRFTSSMQIDYEKWREGIGYDLEALSELEPAELKSIVSTLSQKLTSTPDWRDVDALAAIELPEARKALKKAAEKCSKPDVRLRAVEALADAGVNNDLEGEIVKQLQAAKTSGEYSYALDLAEEHPTPAVKRAVLELAYEGQDRVCRCSAATMSLYLFGKLTSRYDWDHRPLTLRFGEGPEELAAAFRELCKLIEVDNPYEW